VELVDMHQGFVRFPAVGTRVIAGPSHKELHAGSSMMIITMCDDISDQKFLLVQLSNFKRINSIRTEEKGSQIVDMSLDLLAQYLIFIDANRLLPSSNLIWSSIFGKYLITTTHRRRI